MNEHVKPHLREQGVKLNRKLNLVLQVDSTKGRAHVYAEPISRAVFEDNFLVIGRAYMAIYNNNLGPVVGPRMAKLMLMREALEIDELVKVNSVLLPEIERLTTVLMPNERGWEMVPYAAARKRGMLDEETDSEIENALVFFTCASSVHLQKEVPTVMGGLRQFWGVVMTSLNVMEFKNSLPISTPEETTGEKPTSTGAAAPSSIPT